MLKARKYKDGLLIDFDKIVKRKERMRKFLLFTEFGLNLIGDYVPGVNTVCTVLDEIGLFGNE